MTKGERQRLREAAFDLLGDDEAEEKVATTHDSNLSDRHDREEVQSAIKMVKNSMRKLHGKYNTGATGN